MSLPTIAVIVARPAVGLLLPPASGRLELGDPPDHAPECYGCGAPRSSLEVDGHAYCKRCVSDALSRLA
jgi:hypothetical protein